jgi:cytochrome c oxidase cbb3-type subunit 3
MTKKVIRVFFCCILAVALADLFIGSSRAQSAGETLFKSKCAACHGPDGKGEVPMGKKLGVRNLGSPEVQSQSDAQLTDIVTKGKNKMLAYEGKMSKEQIAQLVAYIRELGKKH